MVLRKLMVVSRPLMPMLIGLCLGIALSLLFAPFIEETCGFTSDLVSEQVLDKDSRSRDQDLYLVYVY